MFVSFQSEKWRLSHLLQWETFALCRFISRGFIHTTLLQSICSATRQNKLLAHHSLLILVYFYKLLFHEIGVAVGGGWQALVAYINLGCYYIFGLPLGFLLGYLFHWGVQVKFSSQEKEKKIFSIPFILNFPLIKLQQSHTPIMN